MLNKGRRIRGYGAGESSSSLRSIRHVSMCWVRRYRRAILSASVILAGIAGPCLAQTTGKLAGHVIDASSDLPLPGANVLLLGSNLGAVADANGHYALLGVPAGEYDIRVSFVGYQTSVFEGVEINAGYTRDLDAALEPGVEFENVTVEYERPLIQKDAVGVPKIVTSEQITSLPVRGVTEVAAIQAGVVNIPGRDELFIRGGRSRDLAVYVDGVRVLPDRENGLGVIGIPQSAIQEQEMMIGNISARYGDVMSGVINIVTKSGGSRWFGSVEALTSEGLDNIGTTLLSGTVGGPIVSNRLSLFASGEWSHADDATPRSVETLRISDEVLERLRANPQVIRAIGPDGDEEFVELPGNITPGAIVPFDDDGNVVVGDDGSVVLSDGSVIQLPSSEYRPVVSPITASEVLDTSLFSDRQSLAGNSSSIASGTLKFTYRPFETGRLQLGGRVTDAHREVLSLDRALFAPETFLSQSDRLWQGFAGYTHYFSSSGLIQSQIDFSDRRLVSHDGRFSSSLNDLPSYGDLDHPANLISTRYRGLTEVEEGTAYNQLFEDGLIFATGLLEAPGGFSRPYEKFHHEQWRFSLLASAQVGSHQVELGGEFEQRTRRRWGLSGGNAHQLARWIDDSASCSYGECGAEIEIGSEPIVSYDQIPDVAFENSGYYGYDVRGTEEVDSQDFPGLVTGTNLDVEPWRPRYYGGYLQDKIELDDLVVNLGLRVDVFDNNTLVFRDPFTRAPVMLADELPQRPSTVGSDYVVYYDGDNLVGFRDPSGTFYDSRGQEATAEAVAIDGRPRRLDFGDDEAARVRAWQQLFKDYEPAVNVMPRIGASFPISGRGLVYGRYGIVSQRPGGLTYGAIRDYLNPFADQLPNTGLRPESTVEYEIGYRHRVTSRIAATISGFYKQIKDLEALRNVDLAFPASYSTVQNEDFGTVKGLEFDLDLRRTKSVALNANYTISFADGTGSDALGNGNSFFADRESKTVFPLNFDQRHVFSLNVDIRFGADEGPTVAGSKLLEDFGLNVLLRAASGFPFTLREFGGDLRSSAGQALGPKNGSRTPSTGTLDLRAERRIKIGRGASAAFFVWVTNAFDWTNIYSVHNGTGVSDADGFLLTPEGQAWLRAQDAPATAELLYNYSVTEPGFYGEPRQLRMGTRVTF